MANCHFLSVSTVRLPSTAAAACVLSSAIKPHLPFTFRPSRAHSTRHLIKRPLSVSMSTVSDPFPVCAKASVTVPNRLGDCPFCQKVLLTLEEKHLPYDLKLVDLSNKPEWFLKLNPDGKVPLLKLGEQWVSDSGIITQKLEEKFPEPSLATPPEKASVGSQIFSKFISFLKSKDPNDGNEEALLGELLDFNDHIKENGPLINGEKLCGSDLALGPLLYHLEIALGHYKQWSVPESLPYVKSYMQAIFSMDSFIKTRALPEDVIAGWLPKVKG